MITGYTGISFPFRIGVRGGVVLSTTTPYEITHIEESIIQILGTKKMERWMEYHIFSEIDIFVFEPNDNSLITLLRHQIKQALRHDKRVKVQNIKFLYDDNFLTIDLDFLIISYQISKNIQINFERASGKISSKFTLMHNSDT